MRLLLVGLLATFAMLTTPVDAAAPTPVVPRDGGDAAGLPAPVLTAPKNGERLTDMGATFWWKTQVPGDLSALGVIQFHVRVIPAKGDGPAIDLIQAKEAGYYEGFASQRFDLPVAVLGKGPYVLLPGMSYTWQVRVSDKTTFAAVDDPSWSPWSAAWSFSTPLPSSSTLRPLSPLPGTTIATSPTANLEWEDSNRQLFYYELQLSKDREFGTGPAVAAVYWNLVHGGVVGPLNSWRTPPLEPETEYYWRVRPRVQGDGAPVAWGPTWTFRTSAPGLRLLVTSGNHVNLITPDGSGRSNLSASLPWSGQPVWSPDGRRIAFKSARPPERGLFIMNADGSDLRQLTFYTVTFGKEMSDSDPAWSPDGSTIVFARRPDEWEAKPDLFAIKADGTGLGPLPNGAKSWSPIWSLDGTRIAFRSVDGVYVMRPDGTERVKVISGDPWHVAWSPDGTQFVYEDSRAIWRAAVDGSGPVRLTGLLDGCGSSPAWSADGQTISYVLSCRQDSGAIRTITPDHTPNDYTPPQEPVYRDIAPRGTCVPPPNQASLFAVSPTIGGSPILSWSPDGALLAFRSFRDGPYHLATMPSGGGEPTWIGPVDRFSWSP